MKKVVSTKKCSKCGKCKSIRGFEESHNHEDGRSPHCNKCIAHEEYKFVTIQGLKNSLKSFSMSYKEAGRIRYEILSMRWGKSL